MRLVAAETGEGLEERGEDLFAVVQIGLGNPFESVVEIGRVVVGSLAAETEIRIAVVHNRLAVKKTQKYRLLLLAEMPKNQSVVRGNRWAGEGFLR